MTKYVLIAGALAILSISGLVVINNLTKDQAETDDSSVSFELTGKENMQERSPEETGSQAGYQNYEEKLLEFANQGSVVLFFHAGWCPSCKELDENLLNSFQQGEFPDDLLVLKVDYDKSQGLRRMYGVTLQHTLVQVDGMGKKLKSWNGLYDQYLLEDISSEVI